jgi:ribosomal protein S18 acetylase RimI-like enzyme
VWLGTYLREGVNGFFADFALSEFTPARFETLMERDDVWFLVSQNNEGIDGFIQLSTDATGPVEGCGAFEIATFYVQPRHHGKGIGKALLDKTLEHCRTLGAQDVWLATNSENTPAIGFYHRLGFRKIGITHFRINDEAYENTVFSLDLSKGT